MEKENDGWIEWAGGECPVSGTTIVKVRFGDIDPEYDTGAAGKWLWQHIPAVKRLQAHITAYRVVSA